MDINHLIKLEDLFLVVNPQMVLTQEDIYQIVLLSD
jgi:hypothetical protein